jgi:hypothetical protein
MHKEIQALEAKLKAVTDRLSGAQSDEGPRPPEQERAASIREELATYTIAKRREKSER